mgnify:CR=1 FL=1
MQAILLAGGLGTRLRSVVSDRPKPMALIGEKPFMEYVVHELSRHGITDIIFAVGYKGSMVEEYSGTAAALSRRTELPSRCIMLMKKNFSAQPEPSKMLADLSRRTAFLS